MTGLFFSKRKSGRPFFVLAFCFGLFAASNAYGQGWTDVRESGPFVLRANFSLESAGPLVQELDALEHEIIRRLALPAPKESIDVYLFEDEKSYRRFLQSYFPHLPYRRALYIKEKGVGMVMVHRGDDFEIDLRHECTHAILHSILPMVPLWLDEGLAEYFEQPAEKRAHDNPYASSLRWRARLWMTPKMERLEANQDFAKMGKAEYRDSWAWVHFMLHGSPEAHEEMVRYFQDIYRKNPPGQLSARLKRRIPDVEDRFAAHLKTWKR